MALQSLRGQRCAWVKSGSLYRAATSVNSPQRLGNSDGVTCGWPLRSAPAPGHRWALLLLCALPICPSEMFRQTDRQSHMWADWPVENESPMPPEEKKGGGGVNWATLMASLVCGSKSWGIIWHCVLPPPHMSFCQGVPCPSPGALLWLHHGQK